MTTFEIIKKLAKERGKSLNKIEEELNWSRNTLYALKVNNPSSERLETLADYFNVSVDYLLGRTDDPSLNKDNDELAIMLRKTETQIPESKREQYRKEMERYMEFIKFEMNRDDDE